MKLGGEVWAADNYLWLGELQRIPIKYHIEESYPSNATYPMRFS